VNVAAVTTKFIAMNLDLSRPVFWSSTPLAEETVRRWAEYRRVAIVARFARIGVPGAERVGEAAVDAAMVAARRPFFTVSREPGGMSVLRHAFAPAGQGPLAATDRTGKDLVLGGGSGANLHNVANLDTLMRTIGEQVRGAADAVRRAAADMVTSDAGRQLREVAAAAGLHDEGATRIWVDLRAPAACKVLSRADGSAGADRALMLTRTADLRTRSAHAPLTVASALTPPEGTPTLARSRSARAGETLLRCRAACVEWGGLGAFAADSVAWVPTSWADAQAAEAWSEFISRIDPAVLDVLRRRGPATQPLVRWLAAGGDPVVAARRRQALDAYPPLGAAGGTSEGRVPRGDHAYRRLVRTIDDAAPLAPALGEYLGLQPAAVSALQTMRGADLRERHFAQGVIGEAARNLLRRVPADLLPGRRPRPEAQAQWAAFASIARRWNLGREHTPLRFEHLLRGEPPWLRVRSVDEGDELEQELEGIDDALGDIAGHLLSPVATEAAAQAGHRSSEAGRSWLRLDEKWPADAPPLQAIVGDRGYAVLRRLSRRWHRDLPKLQDTLAWLRVGSVTIWPPIASTVSIDGLSFVPLTSAVALRLEGKALRHCVGTYAGLCAAGASHILSLRDARGRPVSTAEFRLERDRTGRVFPVLMQHRAASNTLPSEGSGHALEQWLNRLHIGTLKINPAAVANWTKNGTGARTNPNDERNGPYRRPGIAPPDYDLGKHAACDAVFLAYRYFLPGGDRLLTRAEWVEKHKLAEFFKREFALQPTEFAASSPSRP
jgi:hypothetical protein